MTRVHTTPLGPRTRRKLLASPDGVLVFVQVLRRVGAGMAWVIVRCVLVPPGAIADAGVPQDVRAAWAEVWSGGALPLPAAADTGARS